MTVKTDTIVGVKSRRRKSAFIRDVRSISE